MYVATLEWKLICSPLTQRLRYFVLDPAEAEQWALSSAASTRTSLYDHMKRMHCRGDAATSTDPLGCSHKH